MRVMSVHRWTAWLCKQSDRETSADRADESMCY